MPNKEQYHHEYHGYITRITLRWLSRALKKTADNISQNESRLSLGVIMTYLPPLPTDQALAKGGHRLIRTPRLGLTVADLFVLALAALQAIAHTLLLLRRLSQAHIFILQLRILLPPLRALELVVAHVDESFRVDFAARHAIPEGGVGLVLQILIERTDLRLVGFSFLRPELGKGCGFDCHGRGYDCGG